jgi:hypothetical protein
MRTLPLDGRACPALSIGSTEHYALPRLAGVGACPRWTSTSAGSDLRPLPGTRSVVHGIGELAVRWVAQEPDPVALAQVTSHVVGTAYDASGTALAQVCLVSGDPYQLTADLLAWGAQQAAEHGVSAPGALGPAQAFGLDALETGALRAGLRRL